MHTVRDIVIIVIGVLVVLWLLAATGTLDKIISPTNTTVTVPEK